MSAPGPERTAQDRDRKAEHIELALDRAMQVGGNPFDRYGFEHVALPEIDLDDIDLSTTFLDRKLAAPLLISCMTGGTAEATRINRNLACGAEAARVAIGVGSQRKALEDPSVAATFAVRPYAPSVPVIGNLGAVQLNYGCGLAECRQAVDMIEADALALHLNPLQEAIQPEGQTRFAGLLDRIAEVTGGLGVPVIAKEIGSGISGALGRRLVEAGVRILDTAGAGGTSWARIESRRAEDPTVGERFADWGIPTPESIVALAGIPDITVIGSGGVRSGVDVAKAVALGADLVGLAQPFLVAAVDSAGAVEAAIRQVVRELKITMFCVGARDLGDLRKRTPERANDRRYG